MKKEKKEFKEKTIKLYEAIFFGFATLFLLYIVLSKYITPHL